MVLSRFLIDALPGSPETERAQPISLTDWATVVVCGGLATAAYGRISNGVLTSFLWMEFGHTCPLPNRFEI
jgi:hypothetical protein